MKIKFKEIILFAITFLVSCSGFVYFFMFGGSRAGAAIPSLLVLIIAYMYGKGVYVWAALAPAVFSALFLFATT